MSSRVKTQQKQDKRAAALRDNLRKRKALKNAQKDNKKSKEK